MANNKLKPTVGKKFGKWEVISEETKRLEDNPNTHWECKCECGNVYQVALNNLMNGNSTQCIKCAAKERGSKKRKGCGDISGDMWVKTTRGFDIDISIEEAWDLFLKQDKKCAISGMDIEIHGYPYDWKKTTAILRRKNMNEYYWLHVDVAMMKSNLIKHSDFINTVKIIANYQNKINE